MLQSIVKHSVRREHGQALVEYGVMVALLAAVALVVLIVLGSEIGSVLSSIKSAL